MIKFYEYPILWAATFIAFSIRCLYALGGKLPGCLFLQSHEHYVLNRDTRFIFALVNGTLVTQGYPVVVAGSLRVSGSLDISQATGSRSPSIFGDGSPGDISVSDTTSLTKDENFETIEAEDIRALTRDIGTRGKP